MLTLDKAIGMFIGLAVGDALGAPLEFLDSREPSNYITKYMKGGHHNMSKGEWTDDTAMAYAMAQAFIDNKGEFNPHAIMNNFKAWHDDGKFIPRGYCFDIGGTTQRAIEKYQPEKIDNFPYKGMSVNDGSGNGGLMRIAPAILVSASPARAIELGVAQTILTHGNAECLEYSRILSEELWHGEPLAKYSNYRHPVGIDRKDVMSGGYVKETYQCAMWAFHYTDTFEDAVITAVNRGYDSDTCGAVTGMIAGAYYGYSKIPTRFTDELMWHDELVTAATKLYKLRS